jgi:hypothetical protein
MSMLRSPVGLVTPTFHMVLDPARLGIRAA